MFPKAGSDILKAPIYAAAVHSLVSTWGIESTKMAEVGAHFDIVEMLLIDERRDCRAPSVPTNLQSVVTFLDMFRKQVDSRWVAIATHKPHTSNGIFRTMNQCRQRFSRQFISPIYPQELTMAARTTTRTSRNINGKCHLIGKLLKDDICIDITKHYYLILFAKHAYVQSVTFTHTTPCHLLLDERFFTLQRYKESIKQSRLYLELLIKKRLPLDQIKLVFLVNEKTNGT